MSKLNFRADVLPHLVAVIVFVLAVVLFYHPIFLENKSIYQNDVLQGVGGGQEAYKFRKATGEEPLWVNSMFSGMPAYMINTRWNGDLIEYIQKIITLGMQSAASVTFLSLISFYVLMLVFGVRPYLAVMGALAFGFNTFHMVSIEAGHIWKIRAVAYMPLVLAGFKLLYDRRKVYLGLAVTALALALEIKANHPQITYYLLLVLACYGISTLVMAYQNKTLPAFFKSTGLLLIATFIAFGANVGRLWSTFEYSRFSTRGASELTQAGGSEGVSGLDRDYVFNWSQGKLESLTLLVPGFSGGATQEKLDTDSKFAKSLLSSGASPQQVSQLSQGVATYWGDQPFVSGPIYVGAIVVAFFILGMFFVESKHKIWLISATVLSLLLAWGKNLAWFNYFMYDYFPYYDKFRAVSMALAMAMFTIPILATLGADSVLRLALNKKITKKLYIALGISLGTCLLIWIYGGMTSFRAPVDANFAEFPAWFLSALRDQRQHMLQSDAIRSFFFILVAAAIVIFTLRKRLSPGVAAPLLALLVFLDLFLVDKRYLNRENYSRRPAQEFFKPTAADQRILQDKGLHSRVLNLSNPWNEARTSYHHSSLGGYHGAKLQRYQELINYCLDNQKNEVINRLRQNQLDFEGLGAVNMLNTKFFLFGSEQNSVVENQSAYGNAWWISNVQTVNSANEEIEATCQLQNSAMAVVDGSKFKLSQSSFSTGGSIRLVEYKPNYLKYEAQATGASLAAFSEIYYPKGWVAKIDGKETGYVRLNYVLRGIEVPQGEHVIEFEFIPNSYYVGDKIMLGSSIALLILFFLGTGYSLRSYFTASDKA